MRIWHAAALGNCDPPRTEEKIDQLKRCHRVFVDDKDEDNPDTLWVLAQLADAYGEAYDGEKEVEILTQLRSCPPVYQESENSDWPTIAIERRWAFTRKYIDD